MFASLVSDDLQGDEKLLFDAFCGECHAALGKVVDRPPDPYSLALQCDIDLAKLHKDSQLSPAVWVAYLFIFLEVMHIELMLILL